MNPTIQYQVCTRLLRADYTCAGLSLHFELEPMEMAAVLRGLKTRGLVREKLGTKPLIWQSTGEMPEKYQKVLRPMEKFNNPMAYLPLVR